MKKEDVSPMILPSNDVTSFGARRHRGGRVRGLFIESSFLQRLIMRGIRILFLGLLFKLILPLAIMVALFFFGPQILGMVTGGEDTGTAWSDMAIVRWSLSNLKSYLIGMTGV